MADQTNPVIERLDRMLLLVRKAAPMLLEHSQRLAECERTRLDHAGRIGALEARDQIGAERSRFWNQVKLALLGPIGGALAGVLAGALSRLIFG